jgi:hypothetical protein
VLYYAMINASSQNLFFWSVNSFFAFQTMFYIGFGVLRHVFNINECVRVRVRVSEWMRKSWLPKCQRSSVTPTQQHPSRTYQPNV